MRILEFEKASGLPRDTIRYYEKVGVLTPPLRGANGYRYYGDVQLEEIAFIRKGKSIGFSLQAIKVGYQTYKKLGYFCPEFTRQLRDKKAQFSKRIVDDTLAIAEIDKMLNQ